MAGSVVITEVVGNGLAPGPASRVIGGKDTAGVLVVGMLLPVDTTDVAVVGKVTVAPADTADVAVVGKVVVALVDIIGDMALMVVVVESALADSKKGVALTDNVLVVFTVGVQITSTPTEASALPGLTEQGKVFSTDPAGGAGTTLSKWSSHELGIVTATDGDQSLDLVKGPHQQKL